MATMVGDPSKSDPFAREAEYAKRGTLLKPALDMGHFHSGAPFATDKPVPFIINEGDPDKGGVIKTEVTAEAIDILKRANKTQNGFSTPATIDSQEAVRRAALKPVAKTQLASVGAEASAEYSHLTQSEPVDAVPARLRPPTPRISVKFKGRFGSFTAPYDAVFVDGIALILVQSSGDGMHYEPPEDFEELITISWNQSIAKCHSCVHYTMPDGKSAHTVYLIPEGGLTNAEAE